MTGMIGLMACFFLGCSTDLPNRMTGRATHYGAWHHGKVQANGEPFDMRAMTLATRGVPLGTWVHIRADAVLNRGVDPEPIVGRSVWCQVTDRGPYGAVTERWGRVARMHRSEHGWKVRDLEGAWHYRIADKPGLYRGVADLSLACMQALTGTKRPPNLTVTIRW